MATGGPRGPVPKRSDQRRRRNKASQPDVVPVRADESTESTGRQPASSHWHPTVVQLYESLEESGQSKLYEPSDWAFAFLTCDLLSRGLQAEKMPAMIIAQCMSDLARLGVTEGDRRRMRVELEKEPPQEPASVSIMKDYRRAAAKASKN